MHGSKRSDAVSYTHLDVYKRQVSGYVTITLRRHIQKVESGEIGAEELELAVERNRGKSETKR